MSYPLMPSESYAQSIGPYATPGWQFAPVPGWGIDPDFSARSSVVAVGSVPPRGDGMLTTMNDLVLPRYSPVRAQVPTSDAFEHLTLQHGGVEQTSTLPMSMQISMAAKKPAAPYQPIAPASTAPRYGTRTWELKQGGYYPVGADPQPVPPAQPAAQYGIGYVLLAGAGGLLVGMGLTYAWMSK